MAMAMANIYIYINIQSIFNMLNKEVAERFRIIIHYTFDDDVYGPTSDVADGGNDPPTLEVLVSLWIHHQQPGLISPFFYEGHHIGMLHGLDVHAVDLKHDKGRVFITVHY